MNGNFEAELNDCKKTVSYYITEWGKKCAENDALRAEYMDIFRERDHYKAQSERYRKALEDILSNTEEGDTVDMLIGLMRDIAEQALEGDEE